VVWSSTWALRGPWQLSQLPFDGSAVKALACLVCSKVFIGSSWQVWHDASSLTNVAPAKFGLTLVQSKALPGLAACGACMPRLTDSNQVKAASQIQR